MSIVDSGPEAYTANLIIDSLDAILEVASRLAELPGMDREAASLHEACASIVNAAITELGRMEREVEELRHRIAVLAAEGASQPYEE